MNMIILIQFNLILIFCSIVCVLTQFNPLSEVLMRAIPDASNIRDIPITKIIEAQTHYNSILNCTQESVISRVIENVESVGNKTCNGFIFSQEHYLYYGLLSGKSVGLTVNELTVVSAAMNGNIIFITCGYIAEGVCGGDYLFSVQIYKADDQNGCTGNGLSSQTAIYYPLEIYGKSCRSSCNLVESDAKIVPPISV